MAELNQNDKPKQPIKTYFWLEVAYSSKQLFISAPENYCTKSIGKFPKAIAHASFLQCSASIDLGQDDDLGKINLKISWNHRGRRSR